MAGLGMLSVLVALISAPPISTIAVVVASAVALPLVPFHKTYIGSLTGLPGNLPAFLALLLPIVGFHALMTRLPQFPTALSQTVTVLALLGMLYGSLKALAQFRAASVVAYGGVVFQSILWWYLAAIHASTPSIGVYVSAVGVATSGLLLAWYMLRARYGEIGLQSLGGLAQPMPKFAVAFSLLALAALGMPPFGVYSGFIGLLLVPSFMWSGGVMVVIIVWLTASWYVFALVQGLLFGPQRVMRQHEDLRQHELASLVIVLVLLVVLGVMPSRFFDFGAINALQASLLESLAWNE
jgi:NADH-quinone oxidoreductase subunit M